MRQQEIDYWEKTCSGGIFVYVLVSGMIAWGIPMFVVMTYFVPHSALSVTQSAELWLGAGFVFGMLTWFATEYRYHRAIHHDHA